MQYLCEESPILPCCSSLNSHTLTPLLRGVISVVTVTSYMVKNGTCLWLATFFSKFGAENSLRLMKDYIHHLVRAQ